MVEGLVDCYEDFGVVFGFGGDHCFVGGVSVFFKHFFDGGDEFVGDEVV